MSEEYAKEDLPERYERDSRLAAKMLGEPTPSVAQNQHVYDEDGECEACGQSRECHPVSVKTVSRHSGQAVDRQGEWRETHGLIYQGDSYIGRAFTSGEAKKLCDAINAALADERENTYIEVRSDLEPRIESLQQQLAAEREKITQACKATFGVNRAWQDRFDLLRDEFLRIVACPGVTSEIVGICERAEKDIRRQVPLIEELAAEREKVENLHKILGQKRELIKAERQRKPTYETVLEALDILTKAYDEVGQPNTLVAFTTRAAEASQQLLSALAAIEKAKKRTWTMAEKWQELEAVDLSLLHRHDAELTEKVRKPLVDELENIINCDIEGMRKDFGADTDRQFRVWAQNRAADALVQVKEKP